MMPMNDAQGHTTRIELHDEASPQEPETTEQALEPLPSGPQQSQGRSHWMTVLGFLAIGLVGVVALVVYAPNAHGSSAASGHDATMSTASLRTTDDGTSAFSHQFLALTDIDKEPKLVLDKSFLGKSFLVYPTVDKKSSPPRAGLEHGSFIVNTDDYVFHFELCDDPLSVLLVREDHHRRWIDESLRQAFDNAQWPGHVSRIFNVTETAEELIFSPDALTNNGFFVITPQEMEVVLLPTQSVFYQQNANLFVEYSDPRANVVVMFSIALLPEIPMRVRIADDRIGYFAVRYIQYGATSTDQDDPDDMLSLTKAVQIIHRRRLETDPYGNTMNPITFHIDPSVPEHWRASFVAGVEAWRPAFEEAGFKNAIRALVPGDEEYPQDFRVGDLRYDTISVMMSESTYAVGPSVVDPRTGEILHSDILFDYGFFDAAIDDFTVFSTIPEPPADKKSSVSSSPGSFVSAQQRRRSHTCALGQSSRHRVDNAIARLFVKEQLVKVDDEAHDMLTRLALSHLTDVVMHEVGHVLGLRHNFAGSSAMTLEQLNSPEYNTRRDNDTKRDSVLSSSIMDYIPVNIWSNLTMQDTRHHQFYMSKPGRYDEIAIQYGYQVLDDEQPGHPHDQLTHLASNAPLFLTDEDTLGINPLARRFDLSNNPLNYYQSQLEIVQLLRNASVDSLREGDSWLELWRKENALLHLTNNTIEDIVSFIGGVYTSHAHKRAHEDHYDPPFVAREDQLLALQLLSSIVAGDPGMFPEPDQYASFLWVGNEQEREREGCGEPSSDYGCLGRSLAQVDAMVLSIRINALVTGLLKPLQRLVGIQDLSPVSMQEVVKKLHTAASKDQSDPRNQVVLAAFQQVVSSLMLDPTTDPRIAAVLMPYDTSMTLLHGN